MPSPRPSARRSGRTDSHLVRGELLPAAGGGHHRCHRPVVGLARESIDPLVVEHHRDEHGVGARVDQRAVVVAATAAQPDPDAGPGPGLGGLHRRTGSRPVRAVPSRRTTPRSHRDPGRGRGRRPGPGGGPCRDPSGPWWRLLRPRAGARAPGRRARHGGVRRRAGRRAPARGARPPRDRGGDAVRGLAGPRPARRVSGRLSGESDQGVPGWTGPATGGPSVTVPGSTSRMEPTPVSAIVRSSSVPRTSITRSMPA